MFGFRKKKIREAEELSQLINQNKEILDNMQHQKMSLETELKNIKEEMNSLVVQTEEIQQKYETYVISKSKIEEELKVLQIDKIQFLKEEQEIKVNNKELNSIKIKLGEEITLLQEAIESLHENQAKQKQIIHQLSDEEQNLKEQLIKLNEQKQEVNNQESQIQDAIITLKCSLKELEEIKIEKQKENVALDQAKRLLEDELEEIENKKIDLYEEYQKIERDVHSLKGTVNDLDEIIQVNQDRTIVLKREQQQLISDIKNLEVCKSHLEQENRSLQEKNNLLQEQQDGLAQDIRSLQICTSQLKEENNLLEEKILTSQEEVYNLKTQTNEFEQIIKKSSIENSNLIEQKNRLVENIKNLEASKSQLQDTNNSLQMQIEESEKKVHSLESQTKELNNILEISQEKNNLLHQQQDELVEVIKSLEADKLALEKESAALQETLNEEIRNLQTSKLQLEKQVVELTQTIETNEERTRDSQAQLDELTECIKDLEAYKTELEDKNNFLKFETENKRVDTVQKQNESIDYLKEVAEVSKDEVSVTAIGDINKAKLVVQEDMQEVSEEIVEEVDPLLENLLNNIFGSEEAEDKILKEQQNVLDESNEKEIEGELGLIDQLVTDNASIIVELKENSIDELESQLENYFRNVNLVGDIYLALEDYNILKKQLTEVVSELSETSLKIRYSNCIVLFMVYTAVYHYDNRYWEYVEECFAQVPRTKLMEIFMGVLKRFELPQFEEYVNALKNITPILCHSGVPHKCMQGLLQTVEELGNRGESVLIGKEAFKELLSEKIDKPVARYIDYLGNNWETFLLECQEAMQSDVVQVYKTILPHMAHFILAWRTNDEIISKGKRTKIVMPRLYIEPDGIGVYLLLPEQKFYEEEIEQVRWRIMSDNVEEKVIDPTLHHNGTYYFIKEMKLPIRETSKVVIYLNLNEEHYRSWQINHLDENFIAFNETGELVGKEISGQTEHFILLKQPYRLKDSSIIIDTLERLLLWPNYKGYRVNIHDVSCIAYGKTGYALEEIQLKKDSRPILFGGRYLFGKESIQGGMNYIRLPELVMYDVLPRNEWNKLKIAIRGETFSSEYTLASIKEKVSLREGSISIPLGVQGLIPGDCFGHYEVKLYKDLSIIGKIKFSYVPHIQAAKHSNQKGVYYQFTMPISCKLNFEDGQLVSEKDKGAEHCTQLWKFTDVGQSVEGKLTYTSNEGNIIDFRIDKQVRTISWGILQLSNLSEFKWSNKLSRVSLENLKNQNDYYLVVEGEEILKSQSISLVLEDNQKQILKRINGLRCKEKVTRIRIHLAEFIEVLSGKGADDCVLKLICNYDLYESEYRIICFQEKLVLKNVKCIIKKGTINFEWEQEGGLNQREFLMYAIDRPWEETIIKSIPDGKNVLSLDKNELCEGKYGILVRYEKDEWGFEEEEQSYKLGKIPILILNHGVPYMPMDKVESYLHEMISSSNKIVSQPVPVKTLEKEALNKVFKAITIVGENSANYLKGTLEKLIEHTESIIVYHLEDYFKFILEAGLSKKRFAYYCAAFNIYRNLMVKGIDLSKGQLRQLWKVNPMLGMLVSLQMKEIDKEYAIDKILNYIGREGIKNLITKTDDASDCNPEVSVDNQQHDLEECLKLSLWQDCYCKSITPVLSQDLIGDKEELRDYFSHAASTWEVATRKKKRAAMQSQQILTQNQKSMFMGKTYLEVVMEMRNQNAAYIKEVSDSVHRILGLRRTTIKEFMETGKHKKVLTLLMKRIEEGQHAEYWCGIIAYLQACESLGIKENIFTPYQSQQLTQLLSEQMDALYERDRIVFQIYLLMEG